MSENTERDELTETEIEADRNAAEARVTAPDPRLGEIEARLAAATPGPWRASECSPCTARGRLEVNIYDEPGNLMITNWCDDDEFHRPDAEFIAHAPADLAYLLAELRGAREALGRVEGVAARLNWEADNANEGAKYAAEVNQGASLMALESERFAYQKAEHLIRAAVAASGGGGEA